MTPAQLLGAILISLPFVGAAAYSVKLLGWKSALLTWGVIILTVILIFVGAFLVSGPTRPGC